MFDDGGWLMMSLAVIKQPHKTMMIHELGNPFLTSNLIDRWFQTLLKWGSKISRIAFDIFGKFSSFRLWERFFLKVLPVDCTSTGPLLAFVGL